MDIIFKRIQRDVYTSCKGKGEFKEYFAKNDKFLSLMKTFETKEILRKIET